jgi:pimeloyl-ACP methyl ester carboxylesterase
MSRKPTRVSHNRIAARTTDLDTPIPEHLYTRLMQEELGEDLFTDNASYRNTLRATIAPILVISGNHAIIFPDENWHALSQDWKSARVITVPQSRYDSHHEHVEACVDYIVTLVRTLS